MINREHIKFLQCFNHQSPMRWSLIKTKLICSELQHVNLLQLLLKRQKLRQGRYDKEEKGRVYGGGTGCWKERDTECFRVTWDENTNQSRHICDDIAIHLRHSHDGRETFVRMSHDVRANVAQFYFLTFIRETVAVCLQFILICIANSSQIVARGN